MLNEDYVVHVLGYEKRTLNEGRYNMALQQEILEAHLIAEGWFSDGVAYLKKKGVEGFEAVKDAAMEVPDAIKKFGEDASGVVAAITAMVKDPEEAKQYSTGINASIRLWPKRLIKNLKGIQKWMTDHQMPTFAKGVSKLAEMIKSLWMGAQKMTGWAKSISMMSFGLTVKYIEEEFDITEKVQKLRDYMEKPAELFGDIKDTLKEMGSDALEDVKDFFKGEITAVVENSELFKQITSFLEEKLGFLQAIKDKFFSMGKEVVGKALAQFAGPIGWLKELYSLFGSASWVLSHLREMLTKVSLSV
jgi:hypothetical protein